jgi:hypothetical protein
VAQANGPGSDVILAPGGLGLIRWRYNTFVLIFLVLLLVLLFAGLGFAIHFLWILAVVFLVFWLAGVALGRGESAGNHHFYRW